MNNSEAFRDFKIHHVKITYALIWLKQNNYYYIDIIIDHEVLWSLPVDDTIDDQLQVINDDKNYDENENDVIKCTFVSLPSSTNHEDIAIRDTFD